MKFFEFNPGFQVEIQPELRENNIVTQERVVMERSSFSWDEKLLIVPTGVFINLLEYPTPIKLWDSPANAVWTDEGVKARLKEVLEVQL